MANRTSLVMFSCLCLYLSGVEAAVPSHGPGNQYRGDTGMAIAFGGSVAAGVGVYFEANVGDADGDTIRLEVELRQFPAAFTGTPTHTSPYVASGVRARTSTAVGLLSGNYGWRFRVVDSTGAATSWVLESYPDFVVQAAIPTARIAAGSSHSKALKSDGTISSWGGNAFGERGTGPGETLSTVPMTIGSLSGIKEIGAGAFHGLAVSQSGVVSAWGDNDAGQLGNSSTTDSILPVQPGGLPTVSKAVGGSRHSAALATDATVWAWGGNSYGQVGNNNAGFDSLVPVQVLTGATDVAAGGFHTLAVKADATVWAWGHWSPSPESRLSNVPVQVPGLASITRVAAGGSLFSMAVRSDGAVMTWGDNRQGQLGNGTVIINPTPAQVSGLPVATAVSAGFAHALALAADGTVWTWGTNQYGLGVGEMTESTTPVLIPGLSGIVAISAGYYHSLAMASDGTVYSWGDGNNGVLGDGTFITRPRPVVVVAEEAAGTVDGNDWYLDLELAEPNTIPAAYVPPLLVKTRALSSGYEATLKYKASEFGANVKNYLVALVPSSFFAAVNTAPGTSLARARTGGPKSDLILAQLTPQGWTTLDGQFIAFAQGVANSTGTATRILDNVPLSTLPTARFCIGYGEGSDVMLSQQTLREVILGASALPVVSDVPCMLPGVYMDGPASSLEGSPTTFHAAVVGLSPSGSIQFADGLNVLGAPVDVTVANPAVSTAAVTTSMLSVGDHSIGATYLGDHQNNPVAASIPVLHKVVPAAAGTTIELRGPRSSALGSQVEFTAIVTGINPTGAVQLTANGTAAGTASVIDGAAIFRTAALGLGDHALVATYGGDGSNLANASPPIVHSVFNIVTTTVTVASATNPATRGDALSLTAVVAGNDPTGIVVFYGNGVLLGSGLLSGGTATLGVPAGLAAGLHQIVAVYPGDESNQSGSSPVLLQIIIEASPDGVPDPFAFGDKIDVQPNAFAESNSVIITGINVAAAVAVSGGEYSIGCNGSFTSAQGAISSDQAICLRHVTSGTLGASTTTNLTIGGISGSFTSTTTTLDPTADADGDGIPNGVEIAVGRNPLAKDNDIFSPGAASARLFAMQMYRDFLGREGDAAGIQGWADAVANGSWTRLQVIDAFLQSQEFAGFVSPVVRLYFATYLRVPDYDGLTFNAGLVRNGTVTLQQLADFFTASPEFAALYGSLDNPAFVTLLYGNVLGRAPDPAGLSGWVALLNGGYTRGQVLLGFSDSTEYQNAMTNEVFVTMMYAGMLRRTPEPAGFTGWVNLLDADTYTREQVINGFFLSTEYYGRFLP